MCGISCFFKKYINQSKFLKSFPLSSDTTGTDLPKSITIFFKLFSLCFARIFCCMHMGFTYFMANYFIVLFPSKRYNYDDCEDTQANSYEVVSGRYIACHAH